MADDVGVGVTDASVGVATGEAVLVALTVGAPVVVGVGATVVGAQAPLRSAPISAAATAVLRMAPWCIQASGRKGVFPPGHTGRITRFAAGATRC